MTRAAIIYVLITLALLVSACGPCGRPPLPC